MEVSGPHQTNKFWANWVSVKPGDQPVQVFTMPYTLMWSEDTNNWRCHYYAAGEDAEWCQSNPTDGNREVQYFAPGTSMCGECECCERIVQVRAEMIISHQMEPESHYNPAFPDRILFYISHFIGDYALGAVEQTSASHYAIAREDLMGIHALVRGADGSGRTLRFPVYRGMAYISGHYTRFTPRIHSPQGYIREVTKIRQGVWRFKNNAGDPDSLWQCQYYADGQDDAWCKSNPIVNEGSQQWEVNYFGPGGKCDPCHCCKRPVQDPAADPNDYGTEYRVYVMDEAGNFADGEFTNTSSGFALDRELTGWVRMAQVANPSDTAALDAHAQRILEAIRLEVDSPQEFRYVFETSGRSDVDLLHWAWSHQVQLVKSPKTLNGLTPLVAPTGGPMTAMLGDQWSFHIDTSRAEGIDFLPAVELSGGHRDEVSATLTDGFVNDLSAEACMANGWPSAECAHPRQWIFTAGFYTNGKGLQKVAYYCLMAEKLFGSGDKRTQTCIDLLADAFKCHYDPSQGCGGVPTAYYDTKWHGVSGKQGHFDEMCGLADFGNACYNDHHYHFGYFVTAAAALLKMRPDMAREAGFIDYINTMVRDVANPSADDTFFPVFRAFDFYDMHSWSHGVTPSGDGKDEESTSEDMNFYFGMQMWGRATGNKPLEHTGALLLSLSAHTVSEVFLMKTGNTHHPADYVKNHVTGIFFENKAHYGTFFGADEWFIHGIQMMPLSPALLLARDHEYCQEEWDDIISKINLDAASPGWASLLLTGNLAIIDPNRAFTMVKALGDNVDGGLSPAWALYWTAAMAQGTFVV